MMYSDKFIAVVKCNGQILREVDDVVQLPFGSEYSIYLKNLNSKRAVVNIEIDGRVVTGNGLVVGKNETIELERFVDGDLDRGYRFKFIQKTQEVQEFRGDKAEDGIIRVEWQWEKPKDYEPFYLRKSLISPPSGNYFSDSRALLFSASVGCESLKSQPLDDEGITVEGSDSFQSFRSVKVGTLETEKHVMVFLLKGIQEATIPIQKPLYVKDVLQCKQCGRKWKSNVQYCGGCGARLIR